MFGLDLNLKNEPSISTDFENLTTLSKHRSIPPLPPNKGFFFTYELAAHSGSLLMHQAANFQVTCTIGIYA